MSKANLIRSCEAIINSALKRLSKQEGNNKKALESEFREWIYSIESDDKNFDILYMNQIK